MLDQAVTKNSGLMMLFSLEISKPIMPEGWGRRGEWEKIAPTPPPPPPQILYRPIQYPPPLWIVFPSAPHHLKK